MVEFFLVFDLVGTLFRIFLLSSVSVFNCSKFSWPKLSLFKMEDFRPSGDPADIRPILCHFRVAEDLRGRFKSILKWRQSEKKEINANSASLFQSALRFLAALRSQKAAVENSFNTFLLFRVPTECFEEESRNLERKTAWQQEQ